MKDQIKQTNLVLTQLLYMIDDHSRKKHICIDYNSHMEAGMVVRDNMKSAYSFLKQVKLKKA